MYAPLSLVAVCQGIWTCLNEQSTPCPLFNKGSDGKRSNCSVLMIDAIGVLHLVPMQALVQFILSHAQKFSQFFLSL